MVSFDHSDIYLTKAGFAVVRGDTHLSKWIEETGQIDHGQRIAERFRQYFGPGDTVVDIGASLGDHTVPYAQIVGEKGCVIAFEPLAVAFEALVYNTRDYPQVMLIPTALGDSQYETCIKRGENLGASHLGLDGEVALVDCLDEYEFEKVKFIKIDVEGWELRVLRGAEKTIMDSRPIIMFEVSPHYARTGSTAAEVYRWLWDHGYRTEDFGGGPQYDAIAYPNGLVKPRGNLVSGLLS